MATEHVLLTELTNTFTVVVFILIAVLLMAYNESGMCIEHVMMMMMMMTVLTLLQYTRCIKTPGVSSFINANILIPGKKKISECAESFIFEFPSIIS